MEYSQSSHIGPCFPLFFFIVQSICSQLSLFWFLPVISTSLPFSYLSCVCVCVSERRREHNDRDSSFPYMRPILSLWFSACLFLGFLEGQHICGETKQPRAATSPLEIVTAHRFQIGKILFVCLYVCLFGRDFIGFFILVRSRNAGRAQEG